MIQDNLKILFLLDKVKSNRQGNAPIRCRITFNKKRKIFSTGFSINPKNWDSKKQYVKPPNEENNHINTQLSLIKSKINQAFLFLQVNSPNFTIDDITNHYKGESLKNDLQLIEIYNLYLLRIKKLVDIEIKLVTYKKYEESLIHLKSYINWKFKKKDILIRELKYSFITDYEYFLKVERKLQLSTLNKAIQRFRKVVSYAISQSYLEKDPFYGYKAKRVKKEIIFLSQEQLKSIEEKSFEVSRLQKIKDMFVFCCYTGLGFKEMINLKYDDIVQRFDNNAWLKIKRNKTSKNYYVPLLPQAKVIIDKYKNESDFVLPQMSNPKFNAYLKEIATIVGIEFNLTHHIARKTFATTVLLYNDIPMEVVSELLGHSKLSTTQEHYAKVIQKKVSDHINTLGKKLDMK